MQKAKRVQQAMVFLVLCCLVVVFMIPIVFVVMNSFKGKLYISDNPFVLPIGDLCVGFENYMEGIEKTNFFAAFGWTTFITVFSVLCNAHEICRHHEEQHGKIACPYRPVAPEQAAAKAGIKE